MPISGLLLTLSADPELHRSVLPALSERADLTAGAQRGRWLPVALEADDDAASRAAHDWLLALPGVEFVDVVCVNFEADAPVDPASPALSV